MVSEDGAVNYGPLAGLIGRWVGGSGVDIAPEPDGNERNEYHEAIAFEGIGEVVNAESQILSVIQYRQRVNRHRDEKLIHDQTGYWAWDEAAKQVIHSFVIPRGVALVAGGTAEEKDGLICIDVSAGEKGTPWGIIEAPFMAQNASTRSFSQSLRLEGNSLSYTQTMMVNIYGQSFEHTDENALVRT